MTQMTRDEMIAMLKRSVEEWNEWRDNNRGVLIDLSGAAIHDANLSKADLRAVDFFGAGFSNIRLDSSDFRGAALNSVCFTNVSLTMANFTDADLCDAYFENIDFYGATFRNAVLNGVYLYGAKLCFQDLRNASLCNSDLRNVDLKFAHLEGANLTESSLKGANLLNAYLSEAKFIGTILSECNLSNCDMTLARFINTDLSSSIVENACIRHADIQDLRGFPQSPQNLRLWPTPMLPETKGTLTGQEAAEFFQRPAVVEVFLSEPLDDEALAMYHFHLGEMHTIAETKGVCLAAHRKQAPGFVLRFQAPTYDAIYAALPDLLAPFRMAQEIQWEKSLEKTRAKLLEQVGTAVSKAIHWNFAPLMQKRSSAFFDAEIEKIRSQQDGVDIDVVRDEAMRARLRKESFVAPINIQINLGSGQIGGNAMIEDHRKSQFNGDVINSVVEGGTINARDISVYRQVIEKSAITEEDLKGALKRAWDALMESELSEDDKTEVGGHLDALHKELEKPQRDPSRLQRFWGYVNDVAPTIGKAISACESWGKILAPLTGNSAPQ